MSDDSLKGLYADLQREYDLTLHRRAALTSQASSLMGFAGIIQTVLVALLVSLGTNKDIRDLLASSPYFPLLLGLAVVGFIAYILTALFCVFAFWEPKWKRVPRMPDDDPLASIDEFYAHPDRYEAKYFAFQLSDATTSHQRTNDRKYDYLRVALISLLTGIVATALAGIALLLTLL